MNRRFLLVPLGHLQAAEKAVVKVATQSLKGQFAARGRGPSFGSSLPRGKTGPATFIQRLLCFPFSGTKLCCLFHYTVQTI